ncbi:unnamed protein product, partial [Choristocarpus tenellus]
IYFPRFSTTSASPVCVLCVCGNNLIDNAEISPADLTCTQKRLLICNTKVLEASPTTRRRFDSKLTQSDTCTKSISAFSLADCLSSSCV